MIYNNGMENRAYQGETPEQRLLRLQINPPIEAMETLLNSIDTHFNNEIRVTIAGDNYQTSLLFLGIHAVALTIAEAFWNQSGPMGYKKFVEEYMDGETSDKKFSKIADLIHKWRNVIAHQWIGSVGHEIGYDYEMSYGWEARDGVTLINPKIYCKSYLKAFSAGGKIWDYPSLFPESEMEEIKNRIIQKYQAH